MNTIKNVTPGGVTDGFSHKKTGKTNTIAVLDGVRACAILFVVSSHLNGDGGKYLSLWSWQHNALASAVVTAGSTGVMLFFVLSGFLLFLPYAKGLLGLGQWPLARTFYVRRIMRIWPGYYLSLFVLTLLTASSYFQPVNVLHQLHIILDNRQSIQTPNLVDFGLFLTFLMDASSQTARQLNGPYWTLAIEFQFYIILPWLALGIMQLVKRFPPKNRLLVATLSICSVILIGVTVRHLGYYYQHRPDATYIVPRDFLDIVNFFFFGLTGKYIEDFAVGMLLSLLYVYGQSLPAEHHVRQNLHKHSIWFWRLGMVILVFSAMWHFPQVVEAWPFFTPLMPYYALFSEVLLSIGFALCIWGILYGSREMQRPFAWQPLRWIGLISYSLYIWHQPLFALFSTRVLPLLPPISFYPTYALYWLWLACVTIPFCALYYTFVERPGMKLGERWRNKIEARYAARSVAGRQGSSRIKTKKASAHVA